MQVASPVVPSYWAGWNTPTRALGITDGGWGIIKMVCAFMMVFWGAMRHAITAEGASKLVTFEDHNTGPSSLDVTPFGDPTHLLHNLKSCP